MLENKMFSKITEGSTQNINKYKGYSNYSVNLTVIGRPEKLSNQKLVQSQRGTVVNFTTHKLFQGYSIIFLLVPQMDHGAVLVQDMYKGVNH